jgi:SpoVK/Ycf46/Vps4 family AAA+-type ATPase
MVDIDSNFLKRLEPDGEGQLSPDQLSQIKSIASQFLNKAGHIVLVVGASGTEETLTGTMLEKYTGHDAFRVDLSLAISKYIGETEKNLSQVFESGEKLDAVLIFDEADSLFGKRTEIKDAHDRFANLEVSYLLERIETYSGLVVLATNLRSNIDEAFLRCVSWVIDFSAPVIVPRPPFWRRLFRWFLKPQ